MISGIWNSPERERQNDRHTIRLSTLFLEWHVGCGAGRQRRPQDRFRGNANGQVLYRDTDRERSYFAGDVPAYRRFLVSMIFTYQPSDWR
jgi:hypothetical protein